MCLWPRGHSRRSRHFLAVSAEYKLHAALRGINRPCNRRLLLRKAAPSLENYLAAVAQTFDNDHRDACGIPSKPRFVDSEAVRQSIHALADVYPDTQYYADLPRPGVLLFLIWQESFATRPGLNQL